jgi:hypothetical protein
LAYAPCIRFGLMHNNFALQGDAETSDFVKHHQIMTRVSHPHDVGH